VATQFAKTILLGALKSLEQKQVARLQRCLEENLVALSLVSTFSQGEALLIGQDCK
jgi:hypothetical protein